MTDRKTAVEKMLKILIEEYGIRNEAELDYAIQRLSTIDLSPFCGEIKTIRRKQNDYSIARGQRTAIKQPAT